MILQKNVKPTGFWEYLPVKYGSVCMDDAGIQNPASGVLYLENDRVEDYLANLDIFTSRHWSNNATQIILLGYTDLYYIVKLRSPTNWFLFLPLARSILISLVSTKYPILLSVFWSILEFSLMKATLEIVLSVCLFVNIPC